MRAKQAGRLPPDLPSGRWGSWGFGEPYYCDQSDLGHVIHQPLPRVQTIQLEDLAPGDIIVWKDGGHVAIFGWWKEFNPSRGVFRAALWEARLRGVDVYERKLRGDVHLARHWIDCVVFNSCP